MGAIFGRGHQLVRHPRIPVVIRFTAMISRVLGWVLGVGCWGEIVAKVRGTANIGDFAVSPVNFHRGSDDG